MALSETDLPFLKSCPRCASSSVCSSLKARFSSKACIKCRALFFPCSARLLEEASHGERAYYGPAVWKRFQEARLATILGNLPEITRRLKTLAD